MTAHRPTSAEGCALVLADAARGGRRVRFEGNGGFSPGDAPADIVISTGALTAIRDVSPADLVATAEAGVAWDDLQAKLAQHGTWVPVDPPVGRGARSVGSVVATGTAGPLRTGFGGVRDHLLGLTLVTGDGRIVKVGGRVAKNVAGYDLTRLAAGSFASFGLIAAVHLRLRVMPRADVTLTRSGTRDELLRAGQDVLRRVPSPAALELCSPDTNKWTLAARLLGTDAAVAADRRGLEAANLAALNPATAQLFWRDAGTVGHSPITLRVGATATGVGAALDLIAKHTGSGQLSASVAGGGVRWSGTASADQLRQLRTEAAALAMPLTLERAPWSIAAAVGHFGAYRDGVASLVTGLRRTFDPAGILVTPMNA